MYEKKRNEMINKELSFINSLNKNERNNLKVYISTTYTYTVTPLLVKFDRTTLAPIYYNKLLLSWYIMYMNKKNMVIV